MRKYAILLLLVCVCLLQNGCKKFLYVPSIENLTGDHFYKSKADVESNMFYMYGALFRKYTSTATPAVTGEFRSGEVFPGKLYMTQNLVPIPIYIGQNNLLALIQPNRSWSFYNFVSLTNWDAYYSVIQSSNILISKLEEGIPGLSKDDTKRYDAEARFIRCFCYFFMIRLYGDVPYYTDAYHKDPLPREDFVSVLNKCIQDLGNHMEALPWNYTDPTLKGVRASRGSAIALLMNMNMWNAGFDKGDVTKYYKQTAELGNELIHSNEYRLLPLSDWSQVTRGRSDESLFELFQSGTYGDALENPFAAFGPYFLHAPYKLPENPFRFNPSYFDPNYLSRLYPQDVPDGRKAAWFINLYATDGFGFYFQLLKFATNSYNGEVYSSASGILSYDNTFLIFRYAGVILLRAVALADLGQDAEAIRMLNMVRTRAQASLYTGSGGRDLKDAIFIERSKELMGEGFHYFDLVRTGRIMEPRWAKNYLTKSQFSRGGWTWPIVPSEMNNNPFMTLNAYWQ